MDVFAALDLDGDNNLDFNEFKVGFNRFKELPEMHLDTIFTLADHNNDGFINQEEFLVAASDKRMLSKKEVLTQAFKYFDVDRDQKITRHDLKKALGDKNLTKDQIKYMIA